MLVLGGGLLVGLLLWMQPDPPDPHLVGTIDTNERIFGFAISPDTRLIAILNDQDQVQIFDVQTGNRHFALARYPCVWGGNPIAFRPDHPHLAIGYGNGAVILWDIQTGAQIRHIIDVQPLPADRRRDPCRPGSRTLDPRRVTHVAFHPDGTLLAAASDGQDTIFLHDVASGKRLATLQVPGNQIWGNLLFALAFSPNGDRLAVAVNDELLIWDVATAQLEMRLSPDGLASYLTEVAFQADGHTLVARRDDIPNVLEVWSLAEERLIRSTPGINGSGPWAFSPTDGTFALGGRLNRFFFAGHWLLGKNDPTIYVSHLDDPSIIKELHGHDDTVSAIAFSADGRLLVSGSYDGTVRLWRVPAFDE